MPYTALTLVSLSYRMDEQSSEAKKEAHKQNM